jgi:hypothetical protein
MAVLEEHLAALASSVDIVERRVRAIAGASLLMTSQWARLS